MKKILFWIACAAAVFSCGVISGIFLNERFGAPSSVVNLDRVKIKGSPGARADVEIIQAITPDSSRREKRQARRDRRKAAKDLQK